MPNRQVVSRTGNVFPIWIFGLLVPVPLSIQNDGPLQRPPSGDVALERRSETLILRQSRRVDPAGLQQRAQFSESRALQLPHPLAAEPQPLPDRLQRLGRIAFEPEASPQHRALVGGEVV